jgi:hypothetical protein
VPKVKFARQPCTRIVATVAALDALTLPSGALGLRTAPDELLVFPPADITLSDPYAIIVDEGNMAVAVIDRPRAEILLAKHCPWPIPARGFAQGMIAGVATKLLVREHDIMFVIPAPLIEDMEARL